MKLISFYVIHVLYATTLLSISLCSTGLAQSQSAKSWEKTFGGSGNDIVTASASTGDGSLVLVGTSYSASNYVKTAKGQADFWIIKIDSAGDVIWSKTLGGTFNDQATAVTMVADGGIVVVGSTGSADGDVRANHGYDDFWVVKLTRDGNVLWEKTFGGSRSEGAAAVTATTDGGVVVAGSSASTDQDVVNNHGDYDIWVVKVTVDGQKEWARTLGGNSNDGARAIMAMSNGHLVVAGFMYSTNADGLLNRGGADFWICQLDGSGLPVWSKTMGGTGCDMASGITTTTDGQLVVVGSTTSSDGDVQDQHGGADFWVVRLTASGTLLWTRAIGGIRNDEANGVVAATDGGVVVVGYTTKTNLGATQAAEKVAYWLVKFTREATVGWAQEFLNDLVSPDNTLVKTASNRLVLAGSIRYSHQAVAAGTENFDYWVSSFTELPDEVGDWDIHVYPNPTENQEVSVQIWQGQGQLLHVELISESGQSLRSWFLNVTMDRQIEPLLLHEQPPGIYFLQVDTTQKRIVKKLLKR